MHAASQISISRFGTQLLVQRCTHYIVVIVNNTTVFLVRDNAVLM